MTDGPESPLESGAPPQAPPPEVPTQPANRGLPAPPFGYELPVRTIHPDPWAHRRGEPRSFAAAWLFFLFAATAISVGAVGLFGVLSTDVYRPAARVLIAITGIGISILWPMVRLSQEPPARPTRAMLIDTLVIVGPAQALIWPQAFSWMAAWPADVIAALSAFLAAWGFLIGALLAIYFLSARPAPTHDQLPIPSPPLPTPHSPLPPSLMMALIILLVSTGPLLGGLRTLNPDPAQAGAHWWMTSPITGIFEITRDRPWTGRSADVGPQHWAAISLTWAPALLLWLLAASLGMKRSRIAAASFNA